MKYIITLLLLILSSCIAIKPDHSKYRDIGPIKG